MSYIQIADIRMLLQIRQRNGQAIRMQNWQYDPLTYQGKLWNYAPFPIPSIARKVGEDTQSISYNVPNISSSQHGAIPLRKMLQDGSLSRARVTFWIFTSESTKPLQLNTVIAERIFDDSQYRGQIQIRLRNPADRNARTLTAVASNDVLGEFTSYSPF
jgi:hypothetical protein